MKVVRTLQMRHLARTMALPAIGLFALAMLSGCSRSPDFNILGSYFPSWIFCVTGGILLSAISRLLLLRLRVEYQLRPLALVYTCLALFFACTFWLLFFN